MLESYDGLLLLKSGQLSDSVKVDKAKLQRVKISPIGKHALWSTVTKELFNSNPFSLHSTLYIIHLHFFYMPNLNLYS